MDNTDNYLDNHFIHRSNWLRAAVGLKNETAMTVAIELSEKDALGAHVRDELDICLI